jgi:hypothetical protein
MRAADDGEWLLCRDVSAHVDELNAEIESLKAQRQHQAQEDLKAFAFIQGERDTLREVLTLLAPDLKAMAILYAQRGDHARSQALNNIAKSVGL